MGQKEVLLIIPAYNEEKNIGKVMNQLAQPEISDIVDVLVMNDASSDNTNWMAKQRGYAVVTQEHRISFWAPALWMEVQSFMWALRKNWPSTCFGVCCISRREDGSQIRRRDCRDSAAKRCCTIPSIIILMINTRIPT